MTRTRRGSKGLAFVATLLACAGEPDPAATGLSAPAQAAPSSQHAEPQLRPPETEAAAREAESEAETKPKPKSQAGPAPLDPLIAKVFERLRPRWAKVLDDPARFRFQLLISTVEDQSGEDGPEIELVEHAYRVDAEYVYPASAIKTFAALAALHQLETLQDEHGRRISIDSPLAYCSGRSTRCGRDEDETNLEGGLITLGHEIRKMLLVSNNMAFNRLVQFAGMDQMHEVLENMGFADVRVFHPLWISNARSDEGLSPGVVITPTRGKKVRIRLRERKAMPARVKLPGMKIGTAYLDEDKARVDEAMDFSPKNWVGLRDFHRLTQAIVMPEQAGVPQLGLRKAHLKFLRRAMREDPLASKNPVYTDEHKSELRYKTMLEGVLRKFTRERITYINKAGRAYGFHLENAYVRERKSKKAFFVTVVLYVNDNGVLNDDLYQYEQISRPFLNDLGEALATELFVKDEK